eukprot:TRINITY_DN55535_c0_g1_i1.p1 TRINITY_DN55535_c0_g1~~TRINITY_DN55535_c0_g1_i1.p1  ORF type:complete len:437 (-),score=48.70 TRINITY_DN55535_c0_g1_i1:401-1711(-)
MMPEAEKLPISSSGAFSAKHRRKVRSMPVCKEFDLEGIERHPMNSSTSSEMNDSDVSSHMSIGQLSLDLVKFTAESVHIDYDYDNICIDNLDDIPHFMAAKRFDSLPNDEINALHNSICQIWMAFVATKFKLNGKKSCVNDAVGHHMPSKIEAGDGMLARVVEPFLIKGRIVGPDEHFNHLTKVVSDSACDNVYLYPGTTYIIHGESRNRTEPSGYGRYMMNILTVEESFIRFGITEFSSPPYSHRVWCTKGKHLVGTIRNGLEQLCDRCCTTKCENEKCLNGKNAHISFRYVQSENYITVYEYRARYNAWMAKYEQRMNSMVKALKVSNPPDTRQKGVLLRLMVSAKLQKALVANKCWLYPGKEGSAEFDPEKAHLKASTAFVHALYPHDADGDAVSLWNGKKLRVSTHGQVIHVCTETGCLLKPSTEVFVWAGH